MHNLIDLTGQVFDRLTVIERAGAIHSQAAWRCLCQCGVETIVRGFSLRCGDTTSCGCYRRECFITHGLRGTRAYTIWSNMVQRCTNPRHSSWKNYGGRGIQICDRWRSDPQAFVDDMGQPPDGLTLDRIDNDGPYSPENCRWATATTQSRNRRNRTMLSFAGETKCLGEWSEIVGIGVDVMYGRNKLGWSPKKILTTPVASR